jgi:hypothetical protein
VNYWNKLVRKTKKYLEMDSTELDRKLGYDVDDEIDESKKIVKESVEDAEKIFKDILNDYDNVDETKLSHIDYEEQLTALYNRAAELYNSINKTKEEREYIWDEDNLTSLPSSLLKPQDEYSNFSPMFINFKMLINALSNLFNMRKENFKSKKIVKESVPEKESKVFAVMKGEVDYIRFILMDMNWNTAKSFARLQKNIKAEDGNVIIDKWRLSTPDELTAIYKDYKKNKDLYDEDFGNYIYRGYWTSEEVDRDKAVMVENGYEYEVAKHIVNYVAIVSDGGYRVLREKETNSLKEELKSKFDPNYEFTYSEEFLDKLLKKYNEEYDFLYDNDDNVSGYYEAVEAYERDIKDDKFANLVRDFVHFRGDVMASDRECAAFEFACEDLGLFADEFNYLY